VDDFVKLAAEICLEISQSARGAMGLIRHRSLPSGIDQPASFNVCLSVPELFVGLGSVPQGETQLKLRSAPNSKGLQHVALTPNPAYKLWSFYATALDPAAPTPTYLSFGHVEDDSGALLMDLYIKGTDSTFEYITDQADGAPILCGTANPSQSQSIYIMPAIGQAAESSFNNTVVASASSSIPYGVASGGPFFGGCLPTASWSCPASGP